MIATCDKCGRQGHRSMRRMAPEGWLYLCAFDSEKTDPNEADDFVIMLACSEACASGQWQQGPGPRIDEAIAARRLELERKRAGDEGHFSVWEKLPEERKAELDAVLLRKLAIQSAQDASGEVARLCEFLHGRLKAKGGDPTPQQAAILKMIESLAVAMRSAAHAVEAFLWPTFAQPRPSSGSTV